MLMFLKTHHNMNALSLAEIKTAYAVQDGNKLLIIANGFTSGFGGSLEIIESPTLIRPPMFEIYEHPGNSGINPGDSPSQLPTTVAQRFTGGFSEIQLKHRGGRLHLRPIKATDGQVGQQSVAVTAGVPDSTDNWTAIHNFMPPDPAKLVVTGKLMMPTPGYQLRLTKANPQGINPRILVLSLGVTPPGTIQPQVITMTLVRYEETTDIHYSNVQIEPLHEVIEVQEVQ